MMLVGAFRTGCESSVVLARASLAAMQRHARQHPLHTSSILLPNGAASRSLRGFINMAVPMVKEPVVEVNETEEIPATYAANSFEGNLTPLALCLRVVESPCYLMWCPRKVSSPTPNTHLSGFMMTPYPSRHQKTERKCCLCSSALEAGNEDIINIGVRKREATEEPGQLTAEMSAQRCEDQMASLEIRRAQKGVVIAVLWTSAGSTGI